MTAPLFLSRRRVLTAAAAWPAAALAQAPTTAASSHTATWPTRPLHLVVGFPAGSSPDLTARALAEPLEKALGQPVVVDNKPGASGNIGADAVAKATDGHTIGLMINVNLTIAKLINPATRFDPLKDLAPVSLIGLAPLVLVAPAQAPGADVRAFLAAARAAGDKWSYGSPGVGTMGHLGMELLKKRTGIAPVHVPYPGYPQVFNALVAGDLHLSMLPPALANAQIQAGKLRGLGITASGRSPLAPNLPSLADAGVQGMDLQVWNAVAAPAHMPRAHIDKLAEAISTIVRTPEMRQRLFRQGWQAVGSSPEALANRIRSETQTLGEVIRTQGIRTE
ncbi:MAG: tripartite tricarboxylate transporter substrate binding protein [Pseudomonadota bacterium]|nr:tripartite tricarboxylate transporter substrate binding protein [Pseudomonadota bacterium]